MFVYTEAEMHILHIIQLILLFAFVCEAVGEVEWKRGPELPHLTLLILTVLVCTGPNGAVAMSSANGLVGTGFASRYQLQIEWDF